MTHGSIIGERERANPSRYNGSNFSIYIFVVDLPSAHERPHLPRTCRHHPLCAVVRTIQATRPLNSKRRDWRVVESNTDNDMRQKQSMQGRPVWNAREKVLGVGAQWNQLAIETPACLKLDITSGSEFSRKLPGRETRLQRLRAAQQLRLAAESRIAPARQTMIYIRLVILLSLQSMIHWLTHIVT